MEFPQVDLSIIIVSWNVCSLLRRCLASIFACASSDPESDSTWYLAESDLTSAGGGYRFEVLVINSASRDASVTMVRREFPGVRLYDSQVNLGYAQGNNLGIEKSLGQYVLLLNPDTEMVGDALVKMLGYMHTHPDVGVLGPQLRWPSGSVQSSRRRFPSLGTAFAEGTFVQRWFPDHPALKRFYCVDQPDDGVSEVDWVTGACLLVRRQAIDQVGKLDESFFMYSEELDWQKRIRLGGWKIIYCSSAQVIHHEGKSSEQVVVARHIWFQSSKVRYYRKHHGRCVGEIVRWWLLFTDLYEWGIEAIKFCLGHKRQLRRERMRAYQQALRSRLDESFARELGRERSNGAS